MQLEDLAAEQTALQAPPAQPALLPALLLLVVGVAAWANSFSGAFVLDDLDQIVQNPDIRRPDSLLRALVGRARPTVTLSLGLNYALGGLNPWGYHAFNLAV